MAGPATLYQVGDHASRPANGSGCVLYYCTTHSKAYIDDGSSWSDWFTVPAAGAVATDAIWDAAGDLAVGTGANTATRKALGTALQTLRVNSGATDVEWAATLGAWTDYTPSWTAASVNPTLGSSTITGRYKLLDSKTLAFTIEANITTGGAWNAGTGVYAFSLPAGVTSAARRQIVPFHFNDNGADRYTGNGIVSSGGTTIALTTLWTASAGGNAFGSTTFTLATGDYFIFSGLLEVA